MLLKTPVSYLTADRGDFIVVWLCALIHRGKLALVVHLQQLESSGAVAHLVHRSIIQINCVTTPAKAPGTFISQISLTSWGQAFLCHVEISFVYTVRPKPKKPPKKNPINGFSLWITSFMRWQVKKNNAATKHWSLYSPKGCNIISPKLNLDDAWSSGQLFLYLYLFFCF